MKFKERAKEAIKSVLRDSPEQDHNFVSVFQFSIPKRIIENLSSIKIFYTMKEVMGGILYHTTQIT